MCPKAANRIAVVFTPTHPHAHPLPIDSQLWLTHLRIAVRPFCSQIGRTTAFFLCDQATFIKTTWLLHRMNTEVKEIGARGEPS